MLLEVSGRLLAHFGSRRLAWLSSTGSALVVGVMLHPDTQDLAVLLRDIQDWLSRVPLGALPFELDGRMYVLEASPQHVAAVG